MQVGVERVRGVGSLTRRELLAAGVVTAGGLVVPAGLGRIPAAAATGERSPEGPDRQILQLMRAGRLPGVSAAVVAGDEVIWARGYGSAHLGSREPVRRDTLFMLASISKTFVATAVLQAVERGLLALDDDVSDLLPFPVRTPEHPRRAITVRHLLVHTSAIRDRWPVWDDLYADGDSTIPLGRFLRDYLVPGGAEYRRTNFYETRPGARYRYSNVGAALAAFVVEAVAGTGFDDWCEANIFAPLGMDRAGWHLADVPAGDVAMPYRWSSSEDRFVAIGQYGYPDYPDGALRTTAPQLGRHLAMAMNGGAWQGVRLLEEATVQEMLRPQARDVVVGQGLIWYRVSSRWGRVVGHTGGDSGVATTAFFLPRERLGVIVLANGDWRAADGDWPLRQIMLLLFRRFLDGA